MDALPLDEPTLLDPPALEPLCGPRAAMLLLVVLAAIVYLGSASWGSLSDAERRTAELAQAVRETGDLVPQLQDGQQTIFPAPLSVWATIVSHRALGVSDFSSRLPSALAAVALVALVALIGEQLGGSARGFGGALVFFLSLGGLRLPRDFPDAMLPAALLAGAIYCLVQGFPARRGRRAWFSGFALLSLLACLASGSLAGGFVWLFVALLSQCVRHDRSRLAWLRIFGVALAALLLGASLFYPSATFPLATDISTRGEAAAAWAAGFFPWWLLLAQPAAAAIRQARRDWQIDWQIASPVALLLAALALGLVFPTSLFVVLAGAGGALWLGQAWPVIPRRICLATIPLLVAGLWMIASAGGLAALWPSMAACAAATALFTLAWHLEWKGRHDLALYALAAAAAAPAYILLTALH